MAKGGGASSAGVERDGSGSEGRGRGVRDKEGGEVAGRERGDRELDFFIA